MGKILDLIGKKFGRLTVVEKAETTGRKNYWICKCDCGKIVKVCTSYLNNGHTKSCGCLQMEKVRTHGKKNTKLYKIWSSMKVRCNNRNHKEYMNYGGRGICVFHEWENDFQSFYDWSIKNGYKDGLTIYRKDNDGNYEPSNCRWVTMKVNSNNKRTNVFITYKGVTKTISQWEDDLGLPKRLLNDRIRRYHWDIERAFNEPIKNHEQYEYNGLTLRQLSEKYGIKYNTLYLRIYRGMSIEDALRLK